jgi:hypothetical protein
MRMSQPGPRGHASAAGWRRWLFRQSANANTRRSFSALSTLIC